MNHSVSIVMAVYNTAPYLERCLQSIVNQTFNNWELICVDDGSTDESFSILSSFAENDHRIKVFQIQHSGIHARVMNIAMKYVTGEYVFSIDSDDYVSTNLLQKLYFKITDEGADLVLPDLLRVDVNGSVLFKLHGCCGSSDVVLSGMEAVIHSLDWKIHSLGLWRTDIFRMVPADEEGFSIEYTSRERFLRCNKIVFDDTCFYYYVQHNNSITQRIGPRRFYYVILDVKVLDLLKRNNFPCDVLLEYNKQCLDRLVDKLIEYYASKKYLSKEERYISYSYLKTAFRYQLKDSSLYDQTLHHLSTKKQKVMITKSWHIVVLYCRIKSWIYRCNCSMC